MAAIAETAAIHVAMTARWAPWSIAFTITAVLICSCTGEPGCAVRTTDSISSSTLLFFQVAQRPPPAATATSPSSGSRVVHAPVVEGAGHQTAGGSPGGTHLVHTRSGTGEGRRGTAPPPEPLGDGAHVPFGTPSLPRWSGFPSRRSRVRTPPSAPRRLPPIGAQAKVADLLSAVIDRVVHLRGRCRRHHAGRDGLPESGRRRLGRVARHPLDGTTPLTHDSRLGGVAGVPGARRGRAVSAVAPRAAGRRDPTRTPASRRGRGR